MGFRMRTAKIRQVKREIRVLGIAVKPSSKGDRLHVVAVVFRGGLWLDGVMRTTTQGPEITDRLVEMITASPHHPQIRVLLLHGTLIEGGATVDPYRLSIGTSRPVVALSTDEAGLNIPEVTKDLAMQRFMLEREGESIDVLSIGLRSRDATRVLEVSTREGVMPEALRVAGLVVSAVVACPEQNI